MKKNKFSIQQKIFTIVTVLFCSLLFAEGSKDFHPSGTQGLRTYLNVLVGTNNPLHNSAAHYVYAKEGERITMASSAANSAGVTPEIRLYGVNGNQITLSYAAGDGRIANRAEELAGPLRSSETANGNKYKPIYYTVPAGGTGIYRVEFGVANVSGGNSQNGVLADADWDLSTHSSYRIAAWDVSVINTSNSGFISGRVYMNLLNLNIPANQVNGSYGKVYVLTNDGYKYRVSLNGMNGLGFTFFSNNKGVIDPVSGAATYLSYGSYQNLNGAIHDPRTADTGTQITHKIFYNTPATTDFPETSIGAVPGGNTWLKPVVLTYAITNIKLEGLSELKTIKFDSNAPSSSYSLTISSPINSFTPRVLSGVSSTGQNSIQWNGKDGSGNTIPKGDVNVLIELNNILSAEVHFPFLDVEYNAQGLIIERLDHNTNAVLSDLVYWNDTGLTHNNLVGDPVSPVNNSHLSPMNSVGISSNSNGHKWGGNLPSGQNGNTVGAGSWGNEKTIDTWTFAESTAISSSVPLEIPEACTKSGASGTPDGFTKVGILTKGKITNSTGSIKWPENVPNGFIVMDSADKGFVITHVTTAQRNLLTPVKGMIIYNTDLDCVQIFRGTQTGAEIPNIDPARYGWQCLERGCNEY